MKIKLVGDSRRRAREGRQKEIRVITTTTTTVCQRGVLKVLSSFHIPDLGSGLFCNNFVLQRKGMELFSSLQLFHLCVSLH